jgi:hypothetical protein
MRHVISALLYLLIITLYMFVHEYEIMFMWACWMVGYHKDLLGPDNFDFK